MHVEENNHYHEENGSHFKDGGIVLLLDPVSNTEEDITDFTEFQEKIMFLYKDL